jgi:hypothetical protein
VWLDAFSLQRKPTVKRARNRKPMIVAVPVASKEGAFGLLACGAGRAKAMLGEMVQGRPQQVFGWSHFATAKRSAAELSKIIVVGCLHRQFAWSLPRQQLRPAVRMADKCNLARHGVEAFFPDKHQS